VLVPLAIAAMMSFVPGHLSVREAPAMSATPGLDTLPGGATTNQFGGGRVPSPPQPV
jgi:hypothetical protein